MQDTDTKATQLELEAERLKLEREAIAVEKERLAAARIYAEAEAKLAEGARVAVLASEETKDCYRGLTVRCVGDRDCEETVAAHLFETLREFDRMGAEYIFGECFPEDGVGQAVMNRLMKAAGYRIVRV